MTLGLGIFVAVSAALLFLAALTYRAKRSEPVQRQEPTGPDGVEELGDGKYHVRFGHEEWRCDKNTVVCYPSGREVGLCESGYGVCRNAIRAYESDKRAAARRQEWGAVSAIEMPRRKWRRSDYESHCGVS